MKNYARSDLACESVGSFAESTDGAEQCERSVGELCIQTLYIKTEDAAKRLKKAKGHYITVKCGRLTNADMPSVELLIRLLAGELRGMAMRLTGKRANSDFCVFVAGLGNASLTADAIGPKTVERLTVTRHLRDQENEIYRSIGCCAISAMAPGVLGQTGIETLEILRGAVEAVSPDIVIVVDSLAARSCDRLASTVQISDTGITPGSGVGNHRREISQQTLGVPVIALGVPTVVDSATLVYDALQQAGIEQIDDRIKQVLERGQSFFVSPKESDLITECTSTVLSRAIGSAFAEALHF